MTAPSRLERASHVAFILTCCALSIYIGLRAYDRGWRSASVGTPTPYGLGERVDDLPGFDPRQTAYTLLAFIRSDCPYCAASMDSYSTIAHKRNRDVLRFVAVSPEPIGRIQQYLDRARFSFDGVIAYSGPPLRVRTVPYLLLIDAGGTVRGGWGSQLVEQKEREVLDSLRQVKALIE